MRAVTTLAALVALALPGAAAAGTIDLQITYRDDETASPRSLTLRCGAFPSGTVRQPAEACRRLRRLGERAFAPTPPGAACTEIFGGPSRAVVTGSFLGRRLSVRLRRDNGCEIARWQRVSFLLPRPAAPR